jgi:hypothetical protein
VVCRDFYFILVILLVYFVIFHGYQTQGRYGYQNHSYFFCLFWCKVVQLDVGKCHHILLKSKDKLDRICSKDTFTSCQELYWLSASSQIIWQYHCFGSCFHWIFHPHIIQSLDIIQFVNLVKMPRTLISFRKALKKWCPRYQLMLSWAFLLKN